MDAATVIANTRVVSRCLQQGLTSQQVFLFFVWDHFHKSTSVYSLFCENVNTLG
jgi:hypothetical protein